MPCYSMQTVEQVLEGITDLNLLKAGLEEMGYQVRLTGTKLSYAGTNKAGQYSQGSYADGILTEQASYSQVDVPTLKKYVGVANLKKNALSHKWQVKKLGEFKYEVVK